MYDKICGTSAADADESLFTFMFFRDKIELGEMRQ